MFNVDIVGSDAFLDLPHTAQALYFQLGMRADDDGFVGNPKTIQRIAGAKASDLELLVKKRFLLQFPSGVVVIKHWKINNQIQKDRYTPTVYTEEYQSLYIKDNKAYTEIDKGCIQSVSEMDTQISIDKDRLDKNIRGFTPPSIDEVSAYCAERNNGIDPQHFVDFYEAKGWMVGKNKMKDWKAAVRTWEGRQGNGYSKQHTQQNAGRDSAGDERWNLQSVNLE